MMPAKKNILIDNFVAKSYQMKKILALAEKAAKADVPILITGESGTGKGLLADFIHKNSKRSAEPFIAENCAALSESLLERELFGHVRGAFTGAINDRPGLFCSAHRGTLFLDEVGDMPNTMQAKILRVIETNQVRRVGDTEWQNVNTRIISATHRNLADMVEKNFFRADLWYRLRVVSLDMPPLRERIDEIAELVQHFLTTSVLAISKKICSIEPSALEVFSNYHWPGNIRQLRNELEKIIALKSPETTIVRNDISPEIFNKSWSAQTPKKSLQQALQDFEQKYIWQVIQSAGGNKTKAAQILQISRRSLYNKTQAFLRQL